MKFIFLGLIFLLGVFEFASASMGGIINSAFVLGPTTGLKFRQADFHSSTVVQIAQNGFGRKLINQRSTRGLNDILGLGPAEIAITLVVGLVLFGPETLKSLSKDVGRAAAELKEIPKTFKEGMDEGAASSEVSKMKALAAEKRKKRDAKLAAAKEDDDEEGDDEENVTDSKA